jgi:gamma-glutamylcysteine synthetase
VHLLCYGIQPVSPPSSELLMKKMRASFWDRAFPSNDIVPPERGDDAHLFTVNASSHVHVGVGQDRVVRAVNVLNAFAGPQLAVTADSSVRGDWIEGQWACLNDKLWDWWTPSKGRSGMPERPFRDLRDYVDVVAELPPVFVKRDGRPILLGRHYDRFLDFFARESAVGSELDGSEVKVVPHTDDIATHNSCYWYNARISRYYTVENRICDQQPRDALLVPAALTLGLLWALDEAWEAASAYGWDTLREMREHACRHGLGGNGQGDALRALAASMLEAARAGLARRGLGEEVFLAPVAERLEAGRSPADAAMELHRHGGVTALLAARKL